MLAYLMLESPSHCSSHRQVYLALVPGSVPQTHSVLTTNTEGQYSEKTRCVLTLPWLLPVCILC